MSRTPFIAGNWKLHLGPDESAQLASGISEQLSGHAGVTLAVFPTAISIASALKALSGTGIAVGVQDIAAHATGAWTGANSANLVRAMGCEFCLVGHSERRQHWGETDNACASKVSHAFSAGLLPILCVGETLEQRRAGDAEAVVRNQVRTGLSQLADDQVPAVTIAYEPVWAIGTGETATPDQAQAIHASIRACLRGHIDAAADDIRILYGGSVKPTNASELLSMPDIDGALVGGASLDAPSFTAIAQAIS